LKFSGDDFDELVSGRTRGIGPTLLRSALWAASIPYSIAVNYRNRLYDRSPERSIRLDVPVVSVGNLTVGGTGKTPCVEYVARFYRRHGIRVVILSRGYGSHRGRNDEALVLEQNLPDVPHLQGKDRVKLARRAIEELGAEILVLDDGFQHRRLQRDLDLVLLDSLSPWGYGCPLPRGCLREPPSSLRRAGGIVLTHCDQIGPAAANELRRSLAGHAPHAPLAESTHRPVELVNRAKEKLSLALLARKPVAAFSGIGNPVSFRKTLENLGARLQSFRSYPDHHYYMPRDTENLSHWAGQLNPETLVVTTQKDLVKLPFTHLGGRPLWALRIEFHVEAGREEFDRRLWSLIALRAGGSVQAG
jgi:tetraacyldisaccharide 4'-kinase